MQWEEGVHWDEESWAQFWAMLLFGRAGDLGSLSAFLKLGFSDCKAAEMPSLSAPGTVASIATVCWLEVLAALAMPLPGSPLRD